MSYDLTEELSALASSGDVEELARLIAMIEEYGKYNKPSTFTPYDFQLKMYGAGSEHQARFACLANRVGKTYAGALEMSYHLTGLYPEWWPGHRFAKPIKAWAIGITSDSTRKVLQNELLGTIDARMDEDLGSGAIPRDCIKLEGLERDGHTAKVVRVYHHNAGGEVDGVSMLEFRSTEQGTHTLMGTAQDYIWIDEEAPTKSLEIFSQCSTRLATTNGKLLITATPENGLTSLIQQFYDKPKLFIFHAGWNDAPHLSEKTKTELLDAIPEWEKEMRTKGLPSKGSGAIFQVEDKDIVVPEIVPNANADIVVGVDFGRSRDPSTIVWAMKDPDTDVITIFREDYLDQDRSSEAMAQVILNSPWPQAPVVVPHDGNSVATDGGSETRAVIMRELGCNVMIGTFSNPADVQNNITNVHKKHNGKEGGLAWMAYQFKKGSLKVCEHLDYFFKEKRSYFYITKGGKTQPKDGDDHVIDAARIAVLSLGRYGIPAGQCSPSMDADTFNNGFTSDSYLSTY